MRETQQKTFTLYWRHGDKSEVKGETIIQAMNNAGYGAGAVRALDFYAEGDPYEWINGKWEKVKL
jgi:hypothetical protein